MIKWIHETRNVKNKKKNKLPSEATRDEPGIAGFYMNVVMENLLKYTLKCDNDI